LIFGDIAYLQGRCNLRMVKPWWKKKKRQILRMGIVAVITVILHIILSDNPYVVDFIATENNNDLIGAESKTKTLPRITDTDYFRNQVRWSTTINATIHDNAAYFLPPGQYGGPHIPCVENSDEEIIPKKADRRRDRNKGKLKSSSSIWDYNSFAPIIEEDEITVIFTFSARYCNPNLQLFQKVWRSHILHMPLFESMPKLLAFDGFGDSGAVTNNMQISKANHARGSGVELNPEAYQVFQQILLDWLTMEQNQTRVTVQRMENNLGPVKMISKVLPTVSTPCIYLAQDDFALNEHVDAKKVVRTMLNAAMGYNNVRYILLAKAYVARWPTTFYLSNGGRASGISPNATAPFTRDEVAKLYPNSNNTNNNQTSEQQSRLHAYDFSSVCLREHYTHKVGFFSDNNHFALTELYTKYLLPLNHQRGNTFVEDAHQKNAMYHPEDWARYYGSHQYKVGAEVLLHLDGRDLKWCQDQQPLELKE